MSRNSDCGLGVFLFVCFIFFLCPMDYHAWPRDTGDVKLKQFVIQFHYNVSQHSNWKPCDRWLDLQEGSWKADLYRRNSCQDPTLPTLPQIYPVLFAFQCWAGQQEDQARGVEQTAPLTVDACTSWELRLGGHMRFCVLWKGYDLCSKSHCLLQQDKYRGNLS